MITDKRHCGEQIRSLDDLMEAVRNRKQVFLFNTEGWPPTPAAWAINWSAGHIYDFIMSHKFYVYVPKSEIRGE